MFCYFELTSKTSNGGVLQKRLKGYLVKSGILRKKYCLQTKLGILQPLTKILRQIADLQEKLTFQAIWKVLIFSLEMTRLLKIEKWLEAWPLGCHPARNGPVTH